MSFLSVYHKDHNPHHYHTKIFVFCILPLHSGSYTIYSAEDKIPLCREENKQCPSMFNTESLILSFLLFNGSLSVWSFPSAFTTHMFLWASVKSSFKMNMSMIFIGNWNWGGKSKQHREQRPWPGIWSVQQKRLCFIEQSNCQLNT